MHKVYELVRDVTWFQFYANVLMDSAFVKQTT